MNGPAVAGRTSPSATSVALWPRVPRDIEDTPGKLGQAGDR